MYNANLNVSPNHPQQSLLLEILDLSTLNGACYPFIRMCYFSPLAYASEMHLEFNRARYTWLDLRI